MLSAMVVIISWLAGEILILCCLCHTNLITEDMSCALSQISFTSSSAVILDGKKQNVFQSKAIR